MKKAAKFVEAIMSGNKPEAQTALKSALSSKVETALKVRSIALTAEIYNQPAPAAK